ncbi:hypothetical protein AVEN_40427-1 [Araneus ventricosus]|uniref:Histone-lysine N-methyltransferase SETMAR n=1 Tax=Araneus ventricosus TaxID=182803 RepID=A0A4Y2D9Y1_ARAVE|nr:hypothetical protein AVEN_40427-1 [Araneus ventricosus]
MNYHRCDNSQKLWVESQWPSPATAESLSQKVRSVSRVKFIKPGVHCILQLFIHFQNGWEIFDHPPYSLDLSPSDFHLFLKLKEFLGSKRFGSDEELENTVTTWLNELAAEEYDMRILKLVNRYDKCLNVGGDYVEK